MWWRFHLETSTLTVRHGTARPGEPVQVDWTADRIKGTSKNSSCG